MRIAVTRPSWDFFNKVFFFNFSTPDEKKFFLIFLIQGRTSYGFGIREDNDILPAFYAILANSPVLFHINNLSNTPEIILQSHSGVRIIRKIF